jgi:hypothetical protein
MKGLAGCPPPRCDHGRAVGLPVRRAAQAPWLHPGGPGGDHGGDPGRVSQIEHGEVSTVEALASYIAALGGKLELVVDIGGHLVKMPANPAA